MSSEYSLGSGDNEQERLFLQRELYGDTHDIEFNKNDILVGHKVTFRYNVA